MIVIQCTHCKRQLSIDDAFAGGVCRCQHCGTIQTVPAAGSAVTAHSIDSTSGRSLYAQNPGGTPRGSGLDDLAGYVASSGLSSARLTKPEKKAKPPNLLALWIGLGAVVLVGAVILIVMMTRPASTAPSNAGTGTGGGAGGGAGTNGTPAAGSGTGTTATPAVATGPTFSGINLEGKTIIFAIDCGAATRDDFGSINEQVLKSLKTFGPDRKFEIVYWTDKSAKDGSDWDFPQASTTFANPENITSAAAAIGNAVPGGSTDAKSAVTAAIAQHPDTIVLVTGKGDDLSPSWVADMLTLRGTSGVRFDTVNDSQNPSAVLKDLANKTGGQYAEFEKPDR